MSQEEREAVLCGSEVNTGQDIVDRFQPDFDDDDEDDAVMQDNFRLAQQVIASEDFKPYAKDLMRFLTSAPCISDADMRIRVSFHHTMTIDDLPESRTCTKELHLSAWSYPSEVHLRHLLVTCAENCVGFGGFAGGR